MPIPTSATLVYDSDRSLLLSLAQGADASATSRTGRGWCGCTDGRNRTLLSPFGASSGRNTPSANKFIFGPSVWLRGLIKPGPGMAVAYIDYSSQEVAIAAALSGDTFLIDAVASGDPYLSFAVRAGLTPEGATKESHRAVRDLCKA